MHPILRKAFRDAVIIDELIGSNPVEQAKRPRAQTQEPGTGSTAVIGGGGRRPRSLDKLLANEVSADVIAERDRHLP
jgi:hypothetical protein